MREIMVHETFLESFARLIIKVFTTSLSTFQNSADDSPDQTVDRIKIEYHLRILSTEMIHHKPPGLPLTGPTGDKKRERGRSRWLHEIHRGWWRDGGRLVQCLRNGRGSGDFYYRHGRHYGSIENLGLPETRVPIKVDMLIWLSESRLLGWFYYREISLIVIIKVRSHPPPGLIIKGLDNQARKCSIIRSWEVVMPRGPEMMTLETHSEGEDSDGGENV